MTIFVRSILSLQSLLTHRSPEINSFFVICCIECRVCIHTNISRIYLSQKPTFDCWVCLTVFKPAPGISYRTSFLCTGYSNIKQTALFLQTSCLRFGHSWWKKIFFHTNHKYMIKLQTLRWVNCHKSHLFSIFIFVGILISEQRNLRQKID